MRKLLIPIFLLALMASGTSAYLMHYPGQQPQRINPYDHFFETNSYMRDTHFRRFVETSRYNQFMSPYMIIRSPYGQRPWYKMYGDTHGYDTTGVREAYNPFYGHRYVRTYHCHGDGTKCHYHNVFPDSN